MFFNIKWFYWFCCVYLYKYSCLVLLMIFMDDYINKVLIGSVQPSITVSFPKPTILGCISDYWFIILVFSLLLILFVCVILLIILFFVYWFKKVDKPLKSSFKKILSKFWLISLLSFLIIATISCIYYFNWWYLEMMLH